MIVIDIKKWRGMESAPSNFGNETNSINQAETSGQQSPMKRNIFSVLILTLIIIFILVSVVLYITSRAKQSKFANLETQISDVNQQIKSKDQLERAVVAIYGQVTNLDSVINKRNFWSNLLTQISSTSDKNVQLSGITTSDLSSVQISGKANNYTALAYYLKRLENSTKMSNISLVSSGETQDQDSVKIQFTINATILESVVSQSPKLKNTTSESSSTSTNSGEATTNTNQGSAAETPVANPGE